MRLLHRKRFKCPWCDKLFPAGLPEDSPEYSDHYRTHAPPSVAPPPTDGSPGPANALQRVPIPGRPDVSPKKAGPLLTQHHTVSRRDYIKLHPDAVRDLLRTLYGSGRYSTGVLAGIARVTPQTIRQWLALPDLPKSDE